jgi:putative inorganic carbon (HCO3(-)) transporter
MRIKKNRLYQYIFLLIITLMVVFNGGNNNLYIQFNFIIISIFFLIFIREKNYLAHVNRIFLKNKPAIIFYILFIIFLIFQTIPLPIGWLSFLSPEKYNLLNKLEFNGNFNSISWSPVNSYFSLLNYLSLFLYLILFKSLFFKQKDIFKLYYFLVFLGATTSCVAIYFYLIGNPDFLMIKNSGYKTSATGFFINRTVFSCFLVLCFVCGIEYLKKIANYQKDNTKNFFNKIYNRFFLLLITIGIITSFSKLGNFLFISIIITYIVRSLYSNDKKNRFFLITLIIIVLFDVLIVGFYFGSEKLLRRYYFLQDQINTFLPSTSGTGLSRGDLAKFAYAEFKNFIFFGYGAGGFENLLKINFPNLSTTFARNAHSDLIEFIGEFGIIGSVLIFSSVLLACLNRNFLSFKNFLLSYLLIFILIFDFSFHIPIIQVLFILLLSVNYEKRNYSEYGLKD